MRAFRFAVQQFELADHDAVAKAACDIEAWGYDEFYSYDHIGTVDPFVPLVVAAEATTRLRVGPLVINNEFHHPALLARTAATVDRLSGGRLVLGMGTGYMQSEHDAIGMPLRPPPQRVDRFEESLVALRSLLDTGAATLDGEHHHLAVERLGISPVQDRVPFLIGGFAKRVVSIGGRLADIFQFTGLKHGPDGRPVAGGFGLDEVKVRARWLAEASSDRADELERSLLIQLLHVGNEGPKVIAEAAARFGEEPATLDGSPFVLAGTVEQIVDKLERLRAELGTSHVVVRDAAAFAPVVERLAGR